MGQRDEVFEQAQTSFLALFRVELGRKNILAPDGGGEWGAVGGFCGDDRGVRRLGKIAVDKIHVTARSYALIDRTIRSEYIELVPADLRDF